MYEKNQIGYDFQSDKTLTWLSLMEVNNLFYVYKIYGKFVLNVKTSIP